MISAIYLAQVIFIEDLKDSLVSYFQFSCLHSYIRTRLLIYTNNNIGADDYLLFLGERTNQYERRKEKQFRPCISSQACIHVHRSPVLCVFIFPTEINISTADILQFLSYPYIRLYLFSKKVRCMASIFIDFSISNDYIYYTIYTRLVNLISGIYNVGRYGLTSSLSFTTLYGYISYYSLYQ